MEGPNCLSSVILKKWKVLYCTDNEVLSAIVWISQQILNYCSIPEITNYGWQFTFNVTAVPTIVFDFIKEICLCTKTVFASV